MTTPHRWASTRTGMLAALTLLGGLVVVPQASATYPGHNGRIAFAGLTGDHQQIYTVRPNGQDLRRLTNVAGDATHPDWSPDGRRIVFGIDYGGDCAIGIMDADGGHLVQIRGGGHVCVGVPSFTPDGRRIVFDRYDAITNAEALWTMDPTGGHLQELIPAGNQDPAFAPDGTTLSFIEEESTGKSLWRADADGGHLRRLLGRGFDIAVKHDWAPDGRHLLVGANANHLHADGSANLATIRPDGTGLRYLTRFHDPRVNAIPGTYSPDGRYIVFRLEEQDRAMLMRMRADGTHLELIRGGFSTAGFKPRGIDWGPST